MVVLVVVIVVVFFSVQFLGFDRVRVAGGVRVMVVVVLVGVLSLTLRLIAKLSSLVISPRSPCTGGKL